MTQIMHSLHFLENKYLQINKNTFCGKCVSKENEKTELAKKNSYALPSPFYVTEVIREREF